MQEKIAAAHAIIDGAIGEHKPSKVFALMSGGHDSLTVTHVFSQHPAFAGVIHINTGIGIPETNQFVRDTCAEHGWPLHELHPPIKYLQLVVRYGFPGADLHSIMYRMLKERALVAFLQTQKDKSNRRDKIGLITGVRRQESVRRMGTVDVVRVAGVQLWISPIHDWSALDITDYIQWAGLKRNPVKDRLHISGECLCGAFADPLERREIAFWYPEIDALLTKYEQVVEACSDSGLSDIPKKYCRWGWQDGVPAEQMELFPLCHYCHAQRETRTLEAVADK